MTEIGDKFSYEFEEEEELEITIVDLFFYEGTNYTIGVDENEDTYVFEVEDDEEFNFIEDKELHYQIITYWLKKTASQN